MKSVVCSLHSKLTGDSATRGGLTKRDIGANADIALPRKHLDHFGRGLGVCSVKLPYCVDRGGDLAPACVHALAGRIHGGLDLAEGFSPTLSDHKRTDKSARYGDNSGGNQRCRCNKCGQGATETTGAFG